jgi:hypothetical protein
MSIESQLTELRVENRADHATINAKLEQTLAFYNKVSTRVTVLEEFRATHEKVHVAAEEGVIRRHGVLITSLCALAEGVVAVFIATMR